MMSFQLQPPSLFPFTLGHPSFHPWLCLSFEPNRNHSYDILGARMLWKPKEARILKNFKKIYRSTSVIW